MHALLKEISLVQQHSVCLLNEDDAEVMLDGLAAGITARCEDKNPVILCVMTGALLPLAC